MKSFLTVDKKSPDFIKYLEGTFSKNQRAIAIESLNLGSDLESVTFEIVPSALIPKPTIKEFYLALFKVYKFNYFLFPIFYISLNYFFNNDFFDSTTLALTVFSTTLVFIGINLSSDYWDHIKGLDRIIKSHQSKPIVNGWIAAATVKKISMILMLAGFIFSIPIIIAFPVVITTISMAAGIISFGLLRKNIIYRDYYLGDLFWSILIGPILAMGFEQAISGKANTQFFLFGVVWGILIFFKMQLNNFEYILAGSLAKVKNPINFLGFEKSKFFLLYCWAVFLIMFSFYNFIYFHWLIWCGTLVILLFMTYKSYSKLLRLKSPTGSEMTLVVTEFHQLFALAITLWMVQTAFGIVIKSMELLFK